MYCMRFSFSYFHMNEASLDFNDNLLQKQSIVALTAFLSIGSSILHINLVGIYLFANSLPSFALSWKNLERRSGAGVKD